MIDAPARAIVRIVLIVVGVAISLYLLYLLRKPIGWILIAIFLAVALAAPVNWLASADEARLRDHDRLRRRCWPSRSC